MCVCVCVCVYIYRITSDITLYGVTSDKPVKDPKGMVDMTLYGVTSDKPLKDG